MVSRSTRVSKLSASRRGSRAGRGRTDRRSPPRQTTAADAPTPAFSPILVALVLAVAALVVFVRWRLAGMPLERDEGEYAYAGQLILGGVPPYEAVYNMKFPGAYYMYALVMGLLGQTDWAIRIGLLIIHLMTAGFVFAVARRWAGPVAATVSAATFLLLGLDRWAMGVFAHATHFISLPAVAALYFFDRARESGRTRWFLAAGAAAGLAVVMKQHAAVFPVLVAVLAFASGWGVDRAMPWRRLGVVTLGSLLPLALMVAVLAAGGVLGRFWFWTFGYAASYVSINSVSSAWPVVTFAWSYVTQANWWLWYAAIAGPVSGRLSQP